MAVSPKKKSTVRNYNPTSGELCEKLEAIVQEVCMMIKKQQTGTSNCVRITIEWFSDKREKEE